MGTKIRVLFSSEVTEVAIKCVNDLRAFGLEVVICARDGQVVLDKIQSETFDAVVMDLTMANYDAIEVMKKAAVFGQKLAYVITSHIDNTYLEKQSYDAGASYFLLKPYEPQILGTIIKGVAKVSPQNDDGDIELVVTELIQQLGVPAHIKGYHYLRCAIITSIKDPKMLYGITKHLYPEIAKVYNTTPSRVERAIRHAIDISWIRGNPDTVNEYFGYTVDALKGRPTNSEFIALLTDNLLLKMKNPKKTYSGGGKFF